MDRRALLGGAAGLAAARFLTAPRAAGASPPRLAENPFRLGVASGEPAPDGFVLWTRVEGLTDDVAIGYEIADDDGFRQIVRSGRARAVAGRGGAVHLEVGGLSPGRVYHYRFHFRGAVSRIGRTRTIPATPDRLRLALTSCQHWEHGWFSAYRDMLKADLDAVLQVGDYIYEKSFGAAPKVREFGAPDPVSLDDYRRRHALYRTDPDLAAAHATLPFVVTFDDHEVENDYAGTVGAGDPSAFLRRRAAAYQAYFEHMPLRPSAFSFDGLQLYRRLAWPGLATLHVLDTRQYRTPQPCPEPGAPRGRVLTGCAAALDPAASLLGRGQEQWLSDGLAREDAPWSLVVQQTLFSRLFLPQGEDARYSDIWDGYEASRVRMLRDFRRPSVRNPVVLSGDVHSFWLNDVRADSGRIEQAPLAAEIVTSCLASRNGPEALFGPARALNPHVRFLDNVHAGYVSLDLSPTRLDVTLRAVEDLADPLSTCRTLASAAIEAGRRGMQA